MSFTWAEPYPELHKICTLFDLQELQKPIRFSYRPLRPYLQNGPQCGLVALAMVMGEPTEQLVHTLLETALQSQFTYNGELFSVDYMYNLAKTHLKYNSVAIHTGQLDDYFIKEFLLKGGFMLVPYDTDKDNSPGIHGGHKAHWCVISGAVDTLDNGFFVIGRHGKAKNVAIWALEDLANSNQQLLEFSPDRKLQEIKYKLPEGGIGGPKGLNGRSVLIS
ncbi:UPF0692 protein CG33108 [Anthonomus grandis grandis]|uniref:UPF0692 protein CG33108 n=1 Tax=Anthonomus grandis grandis TaxID=2921223 RepID=UPI0021654552|nr:UPF0692 protein CG33108 [Anthonomus grandis grandis]